jgi:hypothetical protein
MVTSSFGDGRAAVRTTSIDTVERIQAGK